MNTHKLPLKALKTFETCARLESLSDAANELCVTQSAVSKQINLLEELLNETLFVRKSKKLLLTSAGQILFTPINEAFNLILKAAQTFDAQRGVININLNVPATFSRRWLAHRLPLLQDAFPDANIHVQTLPDYINNHDLTNSDFSIRFGDGKWSGVNSQLLFYETHIAVGAPQIFDVMQKNMLDFDTQKLIHTSNCDVGWKRWLEAVGVSHNNHRKGLYFDVQDLSIRAAIDAQGLALADEHMVIHEINEGSLLQWRGDRVVGKNAYWLVCKPETLTMPGMELIAQWFLDQI